MSNDTRTQNRYFNGNIVRGGPIGGGNQISNIIAPEFGVRQQSVNQNVVGNYNGSGTGSVNANTSRANSSSGSGYTNKLPAIESKSQNQNSYQTNQGNQGGDINLNSYYKISNDSFVQEMNSMKMLMKSLLENQNELQAKYVNFSRYSSEFESISKISNLKINEMDSKLTDILISFNDYLTFNEKTASKLAELNQRTETFAERRQIEELTNLLYDLKKNFDFKASENKNSIDDVSRKNEILTSEFESYQRFTLERISRLQEEQKNGMIAFQESCMKFEDSKEKKFNESLKLISERLKMTENELDLGKSHRDLLITNLKSEVENTVKDVYTKLSEVEKNNLLSEQKLINYSKESIQSFSDLINQYNAKAEVELEKVKSISYSMIERVESDVMANTEKLSKSLISCAEKIEELNSKEIELENLISSQFSELNHFTHDNRNTVANHTKEIDALKAHFETYKKDFAESSDQKTKDYTDSLESKMRQLLSKLRQDFRDGENKTNKELADLRDRFDNTEKSLVQGSANVTGKLDKLLKEMQMDKDMVDAKIERRLEGFKNEFDEFKRKLIVMMNLHIDSFKSKLSTEQKDLVDNISLKLNQKISILESDIKSYYNDYRTILEGSLQSKIVDQDKRQTDSSNIKISKLQEQIDLIKVRINPTQI